MECKIDIYQQLLVEGNNENYINIFTGNS